SLTLGAQVYHWQPRSRQQLYRTPARPPAIGPDPGEESPVKPLGTAWRQVGPGSAPVPERADDHPPEAAHPVDSEEHPGASTSQPALHRAAVVAVHHPGLARDQLVHSDRPLLTTTQLP